MKLTDIKRALATLYKNGLCIFWGKYIFFILIIGLILFVNLKPPLDPDMGWHLRTGQYILETKTIPYYDPFSYIKQEWTPHEWLSDVILYFIYAKGGLFALSIIFALITTSAFFIVSKLIKVKTEYCLVATLLASAASAPITGIRVQMLTLLNLAILFYILFRFRSNQSKTPHQNLVWGLPLLFFVWVNLHGGFAVGLFAFGFFLFLEGLKIAYLWIKENSQIKNQIRRYWRFLKSKFKLFKPKIVPGSKVLSLAKKQLSKASVYIWNLLKKKLSGNELIKESLSFQSWLKLSYIAMFCFAATFINPCGGKVYLPFILWGEGGYGRERIGEWQPVTFYNLMSWNFLIYLTLLAILALIYFKKIDFALLGLVAAFGFLSFSSWRNMPLLMIITTPLWVYIVKSAVGPLLSEILKQKLVLLLLLIGTFFIGYNQIYLAFFTSFNPEFLAEKGGYPKGAVDYIKANPEKFQGNMFNEYNWGGYLVWQLPEKKVFIDGRMIQIEIFKEFNDFKTLNNPEKIIEKYDIEWILLYKNSLPDYYLPYHSWEKVYEDDLSVLYTKKN